MSPSKTDSKDLYPNARKVILEILNATKGERCIFRGESSIHLEPNSSSLYRQLKREKATPKSIPQLLKNRQNELVRRIRLHTTEGGSDLERLVVSQHYGAKTNLLEFTESAFVALFFACFDSADDDGRIIVKRRDHFSELEIGENNTFPDDKVVLLKPSRTLLRARDQRTVLLHSPAGFLPLETDEAVVIKAKFKLEILENLKNEHGISYETVFDDIQGAIELQKREDEKRVSKRSQPMATRPRGVASREKPKPTIKSYMRLLKSPKTARRDDLISMYANSLIETFTNSLERNPRNVETYHNRAFVYQSKPTPDYDKALSDYDRAIELKPDSAETYYNRGAVYCKKSPPDYERGISDFDRAIKLKPELAEAYYNRGTTYREKSPPDYERAISDYDRAIKLKPELAEAYYNRGTVYATKPDPDYERAISDYDRAIALNPYNTGMFYNRGTAYATKPDPDYERAISDFTHAIMLDPNYAKAYNNRGRAYSDKPNPDYAQAISDYDRALELNPELTEAYRNRGLAYSTKPNPDYAQAILDYNRALELNPNYAGAYNARGNLYSTKPQANHTKAIADYNRALELNPNYARAYNNRGLANYMKPQPDYVQALSDFNRALELDPSLATTYFLRGVVHAILGDGPKARRDYNEAVEKNEKIADYPVPPELSSFLKSSTQSVQPGED